MDNWVLQHAIVKVGLRIYTVPSDAVHVLVQRKQFLVNSDSESQDDA